MPPRLFWAGNPMASCASRVEHHRPGDGDTGEGTRTAAALRANPSRSDIEFFVDLSGRPRKVGKRNIAAAVSEAGYFHVRSIDRVLNNRSGLDRTVIVTFQPQLVSELAIGVIGNKLASLDPERIIVIAELAKTKCWVFADGLLALRNITALVRGEEGAAASTEICERPV
jgi:hypothetical protein